MCVVSKLVAGAALASVVALAAGSAGAATIAPTITTSGDTETGTFSDSFTGHHSMTAFTDTIPFTLSSAGSFSGSVSASSVKLNQIKLTSVSLTNPPFVNDSFSITSSPGSYFASLAGVSLPAGSYLITIVGAEKNTVSYTGNFTFLAVPEPATWAMMITGLGLLGLAARRRRELIGAAA